MNGFRIGYACVPAFYAAVERLDDPALRARPVVVGGDPAKRGKVQSASADAAAAGIAIGMPLDEARARLPAAVLMRTNMKRYREVANVLQGLLREWAHGLETDGLHAGFFELAPALHGDRAGVEAHCERLRQEVREGVGLPVQLGVAPVKFLARLASASPGPTGCLAIAYEEVAGFLAPVAVDRLPGVGSKSLLALRELKIETVGDLRACEPREVERALGRQAARILAYARGEDPAAVRLAKHPKSISLESTFDVAVLERDRVEDRLRALCQDAEVRLRQQQLECARTSLKLRYDDADKPRTWTRKLARAICDAQGLYAAGQNLLDRSEVGRRAIRLLGVSLSGLGPRAEDDRQLELFDS